jgi:hypothetical protein
MRAIRSAFSALTAIGVALLAAPAGSAPVIEGTYYEDNASASCAGSSVCDAVFTIIRKGTLVLVTHVSCHAEVNWAGSYPGVLSNAKLMRMRGGDIDFVREEILARSAEAVNTVNYYRIGGTTSFLYRSGDRPLVRLQSVTSNYYLKCRITGQMQTPS